MRSYPSWIAGLDYRGPDGTDRGKYCAGFSIGTNLELVPEPDNRHDSDAVSIRHLSRHLGFVPRRHNWVSRAIDEGKTIQCEVVDIEIVSGTFFSRRAEHVETRIAVLPSTFALNSEQMLVVRQRAARKSVEESARKWCYDGLRVLAYLATVDGVRSPDEHNIEISLIESRLIAGGFERDPELLAMLAEQAVALCVGKAAMTRSVNALAKDEAYFRLVHEAVSHIADFDGQVDANESEVFDRLTKAGKANSWL